MSVRTGFFTSVQFVALALEFDVLVESVSRSKAAIVSPKSGWMVAVVLAVV